MLKNKRIVLGSGSPRRAQLLQELGLQFEVIPAKVEENFPESLNKYEVAEYIARKKGGYFSVKEGELIITADTVVILQNEILGKSKDKHEAFEMLQMLSGNVH